MLNKTGLTMDGNWKAMMHVLESKMGKSMAAMLPIV
jgi:hypothetical protein